MTLNLNKCTNPLKFISLISNTFLFYIVYKYDRYSAKIDDDGAFGIPVTYKENVFIQININNIKSNKVRRTLKFLNIFKKWYIYKKINHDHDGKYGIYISREKIDFQDKYHGSRCSIDYKSGLSEYYVMLCTITKEHDKIKLERKKRYDKKMYKELEIHLDRCIKFEMQGTYFKSFYGNNNDDPLFIKLLKSDRPDFVIKFIESIDDLDKLKMIVSKKWLNMYDMKVNYIKNDKIKNIIEGYLENDNKLDRNYKLRKILNK